MKYITPCLLLAAGLGLAGCGTMGDNMSSGGTARTSGGAEAANADVKGSTSATGATPANSTERR